MIERKIMNNLLAWKNNKEKKALLIEGARQVGKTYIVRKFAEKNYQKNFIEINFIENNFYKEIFSEDISFEGIFRKLKILFSPEIFENKTLIF